MNYIRKEKDQKQKLIYFRYFFFFLLINIFVATKIYPIFNLINNSLHLLCHLG